MDMNESNDEALNALLQMAKACESSSTSNVSTIRTLILKAMSHPEIFSGFDQLKQEVQGKLDTAPDREILLKTLDLFSYGSYRDYLTNEAQYLSMTEALLQKLRMLTLVTLVQDSCIASDGVVMYSALADGLGLGMDQTDSFRLVEEVIIACIDAGIVNGKLCQKTKTLHVSSEDGPPCRARDVPASQLASMLETLRGLQANLERTVLTMEAKKTNTKFYRDASVEFWRNVKETSANRNFRGPAGTASLPSMNRSLANQSARSRDLATRASPRRQGKRVRGGLAGALSETMGRY